MGNYWGKWIFFFIYNRNVEVISLGIRVYEKDGLFIRDSVIL